jgi:hypothetical protein
MRFDDNKDTPTTDVGERGGTMPVWMTWAVIIWVMIMIGFLSIGGYFMFRKFLKGMPKGDGKSILEWQAYYIEKTRHMWSGEQKELLEELVRPVPKMFRDTARQTIAGKIGELALKENADHITEDLIIRGYIQATPKRDHKWLIQTLKEKKIDLTPYQEYF